MANLHIPTGREALVLLALSGAGIFGNYLNVSLFFGVEFIFGSIATIIALRISGVVWGTIVGVAIASYTILLWGHSYAVFIFGLEAFVVGIFLCCLKKDNAVLVDASYWLVIGMPLVWVFYTYLLGLPETAVHLIMLKQAVNGIFNVVIATLVLQFTPLHAWTKGLETNSGTWPLQQLLNTVLTGAVLAPILIITAVSTRGELHQVQSVLDHQVVVRLDHAVDKLSNKADNLAKLVTLISNDILYDQEHAKTEAYSILKNFPELVGLGLFKANGEIVATYGMGMDRIDTYLGLFPLTITKTLLISLPVTRNAGASTLLAIVVPFGEENLYAIGWLEPGYFDNTLSEVANAELYKLDLRDAQGRLIATNNIKLDLRSFVSGVNPNHLLPANTDLPDMVRWRKSFWVHQEPVEIGDGWTLTYGRSMASMIDVLQEDYVEKLFLAFVVEILVLLLVPLAVRAIYQPIVQLTVAANLLKESTTREDIIWPDETFTEIGSLVTGFKDLIRRVNSNAQKLKESESGLANAQRIAHLGNWNWDIVTDELFWSDEIYNIFGLEPQQFDATVDAFMDSVHPDDRADVQETIDMALDGKEPYSVDHRIVLPSGEQRFVHEQAEVTFDDTGKPIRMSGTVQDITELRDSQQQVIQASKLATLGEMATGVAHELNQPLNVIRMAAGNTRLRLENGDIDREYIENKLIRIEEQTERAAAIIDHMRMFGRKAEEDAHPIDPREIINNALGLIGEQFRLEGIEISTEFPADCAMIMGHGIQLEQVVLNLLTNAKDAIDANAGDRKIAMTITREDGRVCMKFEDTGGGIPEDVLPRVFEPFYTTKEMGKGTGLGLSVSYGIIRDMGGAIEVENGSQGACFTITLPAVAASQAITDKYTGPAPAIAMEG